MVDNFISSNSYIVLPTRSKPRVYLAIVNSAIARLSFDLYNPFSRKAKVLKNVTKFICVYCNPLARLVLPTIQVKKSNFIEFLEESFKKKLVTSLYIATAKDKVVLQLQDDNGVLGYLKYPITPLGEQRLLNEVKANTILSKLRLVPELLFVNSYKGTQFIVLQNHIGTIGHANQQDYKIILDRFKKDKSYKLINHPRILNLIDKLSENNLVGLCGSLKHLLKLSKKTYMEVFEHGDFAPWNLLKTEKGIIPFDFEYFEERGLEHMDELKYNFQVEHLLHGKKDIALIDRILAKMNIEEIELIFQVFLIKEIVNKHESKEPTDFENSLLKILQIGKV